MFRRSVIERVGGFKTSYSPAEDYELLLNAARRFSSAHHRSVVAEYRRHDANTSRNGSLMLRMMHKVMQSRVSFVNENSKLRAAHRKGELYWRDHFGVATIREIYTHLIRCEPWRAARAFAALFWYARGRLFVLPWKYRWHALRVLRLTQQPRDRRASSVVNG